MATNTKSELRDDVLRELNALAAGQTAGAEDAALVESRIQNVLEMLDDEEVITWNIDSDDIPSLSYLPLIPLVAATLAGAFGQQARAAEFETKSERALRTLRRQAQLPYVPTTAQANYF